MRLYDNTDHGTGTLYGDTPGYDGDHDLGVAYSVAQVPRVAGRCGCCGDDVASMDQGYCCDDCDTAGCEPSEDACGEVAYWECERTDSVSAIESAECEGGDGPCPNACGCGCNSGEFECACADAGCTCHRIPGTLEYTKCAFCKSLERNRQ
jgi:hypothetical protein